MIPVCQVIRVEDEGSGTIHGLLIQYERRSVSVNGYGQRRFFYRAKTTSKLDTGT